MSEGRRGTLELTAPLALDWVVVDFGQAVPRPDHDLVQLRVPETADHALEMEGGRKKIIIKSSGTRKGKYIQDAEENSDENAPKREPAAPSCGGALGVDSPSH